MYFSGAKNVDIHITDTGAAGVNTLLIGGTQRDDKFLLRRYGTIITPGVFVCVTIIPKP